MQLSFSVLAFFSLLAASILNLTTPPPILNRSTPPLPARSSRIQVGPSTKALAQVFGYQDEIPSTLGLRCVSEDLISQPAAREAALNGSPVRHSKFSGSCDKSLEPMGRENASAGRAKNVPPALGLFAAGPFSKDNQAGEVGGGEGGSTGGVMIMSSIGPPALGPGGLNSGGEHTGGGIGGGGSTPSTPTQFRLRVRGSSMVAGQDVSWLHSQLLAALTDAERQPRYDQILVQEQSNNGPRSGWLADKRRMVVTFRDSQDMGPMLAAGSALAEAFLERSAEASAGSARLSPLGTGPWRQISRCRPVLDGARRRSSGRRRSSAVRAAQVSQDALLESASAAAMARAVVGAAAGRRWSDVGLQLIASAVAGDEAVAAGSETTVATAVDSAFFCKPAAVVDDASTSTCEMAMASMIDIGSGGRNLFLNSGKDVRQNKSIAGPEDDIDSGTDKNMDFRHLTPADNAAAVSGVSGEGASTENAGHVVCCGVAAIRAEKSTAEAYAASVAADAEFVDGICCGKAAFGSAGPAVIVEAPATSGDSGQCSNCPTGKEHEDKGAELSVDAAAQFDDPGAEVVYSSEPVSLRIA